MSDWNKRHGHSPGIGFIDSIIADFQSRNIERAARAEERVWEAHRKVAEARYRAEEAQWRLHVRQATRYHELQQVVLLQAVETVETFGKLTIAVQRSLGGVTQLPTIDPGRITTALAPQVDDDVIEAAAHRMAHKVAALPPGQQEEALLQLQQELEDRVSPYAADEATREAWRILEFLR